MKTRLLTGCVVAATCAATAACGGSTLDSAAPSMSPHTGPSSATPSSSAGTTPPFADLAVKTTQTPSEVAPGYGSLWVVSHRGSTVTQIDPRSGAVRAEIASSGSNLIGLALSAGHVWYLDAGRQKVEAIDVKTGKVDISVLVYNDGGGLSPAPDGVWFAGVHGKVLRLDRRGNISATFAVGGPDDRMAAVQLGDRLFVSDAETGLLEGLDPRTGKVEARKRLGGDIGVLSAGAGDLWVGAWSGALKRVDPATLAVAKTIPTEAVDHVAVCGRTVWVRISDTELTGYDRSTGAEVKTYDRLPASEIPGGGITCAAGALWVVNWSESDVYRIPLA